ncbi:MAG: MlaD family protein [Actinomycetota bacterium]|nr:MlaD family protein [Actinomycetota bacterium]MDQ5807466.1 MlaD family protein [Actinomycetota bacterium]
MKRAIRNHWRDFTAIIVLFVIALGVASYILSQQRFNLPGWVPGIGQDFYILNAEFSTAKSVTPGQGQTVTIAGVNVGEISKVELREGRALVEMKLQNKYGERVRKDASLLLRPKTGLEDMVIEMAPGTPAAAKADEGWTIPVENTLPTVNLEDILASLDRDTRDYLRLLVAGAGRGLEGAGDDLAATFKRFEPGAQYARRMTAKLIERRGSIRRSIHNLRLLVEAVGEKDDQLAQLIDSSNTVFRSFVNQDANLRDALQQLPPTLQVTNTGLRKTERLANVLGPALEDLRPTARALGPTLRQVRPFLLRTEPVIRTQLRPFARDVLPTVRSLRRAARGLADVTPDLRDTLRVLNYLFNEIAYNAPGKEDEGYLFWASWANHLGTLTFATQDAHGPIRRGTILISCTTADVLNTIIASDPRLGTIAQLSGLPQERDICPQSSQAGGTDPGATGGGR